MILQTNTHLALTFALRTSRTKSDCGFWLLKFRATLAVANADIVLNWSKYFSAFSYDSSHSFGGSSLNPLRFDFRVNSYLIISNSLKVFLC